jgi:hypothetical protein
LRFVDGLRRRLVEFMRTKIDDPMPCHAEFCDQLLVRIKAGVFGSDSHAHCAAFPG